MEQKTICWNCKNSCGDCPWSKSFQPVEGWHAVKTKIVNSDREIDSFVVIDCPMFEIRDRRLYKRADYEFYLLFKTNQKSLAEKEIRILETYFALGPMKGANALGISIRTLYRKISNLKKQLDFIEKNKKAI